jgi:hypothetical protein
VKPPIGFVLVTHNNPDQTRFLCEQLTDRFDRPPIVIHHDFSQTPLNTSAFPANVAFVSEWIKTSWGGYSVITAQLRALRLLYRNSNPDWFVVLSGADYPINTADFILSDLYGNGFDAHLDNRRIQYCRLPIPPEGFGDQNFVDPRWVTLAFERYMAIGFGFYKIATRLKWKRKAFYLRSNFFIKRLTPFDGSLDCYAGDHWLTGNRKVAEILLEDSDTNARLSAHFRKRPNADEGYLQTVLCNAPGLNISPDNKRFTDWRGCTNHPRPLTEAEFPAILESTDHFGRKFVFNPEALRKLDDLVDHKARSMNRHTNER